MSQPVIEPTAFGVSYYGIDNLPDALGIVPLFVARAIHNEDWVDGIIEQYGFPAPDMSEVVTRDREDKLVSVTPPDEDGYQDPPLEPIAIMKTGRGRVYFYHYGIVCIEETNKPDRILRMD